MRLRRVLGLAPGGARTRREPDLHQQTKLSVRDGATGTSLTLYHGPGCTLGGMDHLTTIEVARRGGVNLETVRYYERRGLLPKPPRLASGYRAFDPDAVQRVWFIKHAQALGFSLKEVRDLLALRITPGKSCADVRRRAETKLADIEAKIAGLRAMKRALSEFVAGCSGRGPIEACPILEALDSDADQQRSRGRR